jgi:hypothetical protein
VPAGSPRRGRDVVHRQPGGSGQGVDRRDGRVDRIAAGQVDSRADRRRHADAVDGADFVVGDLVRPHLDAADPAPIGVDEGRGPAGVDPAGSVQRRGGEAGQHAVPTGP